MKSKALSAGLMMITFAACGGNLPDYTYNFTGSWRGAMTIVSGAQMTSVSVLQEVRAIGKNRFRFEDRACPTTWTATSATSAAVDGTDGCVSMDGGCTARINISSGTLVRERNGARAQMLGRAIFSKGCPVAAGTSVPYSLSADWMTRK